MTYNVLSLDGGGIRGIISVVLLERLSREPGLEGFLDKVHLLAGTSTGGLIALGLAAGKSLAELRELYVNDGPAIFADSFLDNVFDLGGLIGADYGIGPLEGVLKRTLGETTTLGQLDKRVLVAAFDLDSETSSKGPRRWKPKLFHNFPGGDSDAAFAAYKVALYTSAAPTYFPTVDGYIDGGVYAPNPSMCALAQTQDSRVNPPIPFSDVRLLSLGTGTSLHRIEGKALDWGYIQWGRELPDLLLDAVNDVAHFQCSQILRDKYHRLAPMFAEGVEYAMDDAGKIDDMIKLTNDVPIGAAAAWIRTNFA